MAGCLPEITFRLGEGMNLNCVSSCCDNDTSQEENQRSLSGPTAAGKSGRSNTSEKALEPTGRSQTLGQGIIKIVIVYDTQAQDSTFQAESDSGYQSDSAVPNGSA